MRSDNGPVPCIERISANDLTTLATDRGQVPMNIAAMLELSGVSDPAATAGGAAIATKGNLDTGDSRPSSTRARP